MHIPSLRILSEVTLKTLEGAKRRPHPTQAKFDASPVKQYPEFCKFCMDHQ